MPKQTLLLEYRDDKSAKFWESVVEGGTQTIRFGRIGAAGQTQTKTFASEEAALAAAAKVAAEKRKSGYRDVTEPKEAPTRSEAEAGDSEARPANSEAEPTKRTSAARTKKAPGAEAAGHEPIGGLFLLAGEEVTKNALAAKLRGEGTLSKVDPKAPSGFGSDGLVGIAVHAAHNDWFGIVDSADGAQGIGEGEWSVAAILANHLRTDAVWYRVYSEGAALGLRFSRGGPGFRAVAGDRARLFAWLDEQGVPFRTCAPPKLAGKGATLVTVQYDEARYRKGPDHDAAVKLALVASALIAGDGQALRDAFAGLAPEAQSLALGLVRGEARGRWKECIESLAADALAGPLVPRTSPKQASFDAEILVKAALLTRDPARAAACLERLDAIERDAETRSSFALTTGVVWLATRLYEAQDFAGAHACYAALLRRPKPHWMYVNAALATLLSSRTGRIELDGPTRATVRACEKRLPELGEAAVDAITYNLACVYARAGDKGKALENLGRCRTILQQNPHPERDADLQLLWGDPAFAALVGVKPSEPALPAELPEGAGAGESAAETYTPPAARAVPRLRIELEAGDDPKALVSRIGGLPNAPSTDAPWPTGRSRPMQLVAQLVGKAAGGQIDLGDVGVVQIFADLAGDYYEENAVIVHRGPCPAVLEPPVGVDEVPVQTMRFVPGADDRILVDVEDPDDEEALRAIGATRADYDAAFEHAYCDKVLGLAVSANLPDEVKDSRGEPMHLLLQLLTYDDWFHWALFTNRDHSELKLEVVRG